MKAGSVATGPSLGAPRGGAPVGGRGIEGGRAAPATISFSSRSLNPNFGRESRSSFARSKSLSPQRATFNRSVISESPRSFQRGMINRSIISESPRFSFGLNLSQGKEAKSKTARTSNLSPQRSPFNRSVLSENKPTFSDRFKTLKTTERRMQATKNVSPLVSEKRSFVSHSLKSIPSLGERRSPFAAIKSREARPIQKPQERQTMTKRVELQARKPQVFHRTEIPTRLKGFELFSKPAQRETRGRRVELIRPRRENRVIVKPEARRVSPFEKTLTLWKNPNIEPRKKLETAARVESVTKPKKREQYFGRALVEAKAFPKPDKKLRRKTVRRLELKHVIRVLPSTRIEELPRVQKDIKDAKTKLIPKIVKARGVSNRAAIYEAAKVLLESHKGKIAMAKVEPYVLPLQKNKTEVQTKPAVHTEVRPVTQTKTQEKTKTNRFAEVKARVLGGHNKKDTRTSTPDNNTQPRKNEKKYYFEQDARVNEERFKVAKATLERLLQSKKEGQKVTGKEVAGGITNDTSLQSEVSRPLVDGSLDAVRKAISEIPEAIDKESWEAKIKHVIHTYTGIRLSLRQPNISATAEQARVVYKGPIDNQEGNFEELEHSRGQFRERGNGTYFIPQQQEAAEVV